MNQSTKTSQNEECDFCTEISEAGKHSKPPKLSQRGKIALGISGAFVAGVSAVLLPFVNPGFRKFCLPYIPATSEQVRNVFQVLKGRSGKLIDIGSGDGRISITAAQQGFQASGVELNRWLIWYSRWSARRQGLSSQTKFFRQDLWKTDFSSYNNVVIFGVDTMMPRLQEKLANEISASTAVVACRFPLPDWEPTVTVGEGVDSVWLYYLPQTPTTDTHDSATTSTADTYDCVATSIVDTPGSVARSECADSFSSSVDGSEKSTDSVPNQISSPSSHSTTADISDSREQKNVGEINETVTQEMKKL